MRIDHVIVMAAASPGELEPLVRTRPKSMLPVLGSPMVARVMDAFYNAGVKRFTVVVGEHEGSVAEWLSTQWYEDVQLNYAPRGHRRGTAATLFATRHLIDGPFAIVPCDVLVPDWHIADLLDYFERYREDATVLSVYNGPHQTIEGGSVLLDPRGHVAYVSEEPAAGHQGNLLSLPIYGFTPTVLDYLDQVPVDSSGGRSIAAAIQMMVKARQPVGVVETDWATDIHTPKDLLTANLYFLAQLRMASMLSDVPESVEIVPPIHIDEGVTVGERSTIGPNVYLESGTIIGREVVLKNTVVLGAHVTSRQHVEGQLITEDM